MTRERLILKGTCVYIRVEKSHLIRALTHAQGLADRKHTIPILSNVLLRAAGGVLQIISSDNEMGLIEKIPANVQIEGDVCVNAQLIYDIVKKLPAQFTIELRLNDSESLLYITSNNGAFKLTTVAPHEFPELAQVECSHHFDLTCHQLRLLIDHTKFCIVQDEGRFNLHGVNLHTVVADDGINYLRAVATDMHRLAFIEIPAPSGAQDMPSAVVSRKTIHEIRKIIYGVDADVRIGVSKNKIEFTLSVPTTHCHLSARLIDATFPDYSKPLNVAHDKTLTVPTKMIMDVMDRVGTIMMDEKVRGVRLDADHQQVSLSAVSQMAGSAQETFSADFQGPEAVAVSFNLRYMMEIAQHIPTDMTQITLQDSESSLLIAPVNQEYGTVRYILMPLQM